MPVWQIVLICAAAAVVAGFLVLAVFNYFLFRSILLRPKRSKNDQYTEGVWAEERRLAKEGAEWAETVPHTELTLTGAHKERLSALYLDRGTDRTAVLVHGYLSDRGGRMADTRFYFERGYNVLVVDNRAHGRSGGKTIGMGYLDSRNLGLWIDLLVREHGARAVVLDGVSMGGATVLCTNLWPKRDAVKAIVSDCSYTSAYDEFTYQVRRKCPAVLVMPFLALYARLFCGYSLKKASPLCAVKKNTVPTLFIHGQADRFVPYEMAERLYAANASDKRLLATEGVGHALSHTLAKEQYRAAIDELLTRTVEAP